MSNELNLKPVKDMTYAETVGELESILQMMQGDKCDIDRLTDYTRRAIELLTECRSRLTTTDEQLRTILSQLEN